MSLSSAAGRLTAVLGPTNTGKTYLAIERMLGHESGMIGFPLRLLARENYDRIVQVKGASQVALITGEEKIAPPGARYFVCTVESMPLDRIVSFLAVDEVQMAADPERGHFFTDRLLHARGTHETMLLGADTIRPVLNRLLPDIDVVARPRFSKLAYVGPKKATRLPRRSAVVRMRSASRGGSSEHSSSTPGLRNSVTVNGSPGMTPMAAAMRGKRAGSILACATRMTSSYDMRTAR